MLEPQEFDEALVALKEHNISARQLAELVDSFNGVLIHNFKIDIMEHVEDPLYIAGALMGLSVAFDTLQIKPQQTSPNLDLIFSLFGAIRKAIIADLIDAGLDKKGIKEAVRKAQEAAKAKRNG